MFWMALHLVAILISLFCFGILRTCLWLIPGLLNPVLFTISAGALLSFVFVAAWLARFKSGFDFRSLERDKWALLFFLSGVLTWALFYPCDSWIMPFGSLFPWIFIQFSKAFRLQIPFFFEFKKKWKYILAVLWIAFVTGKYFYAP